MNDRHPTTETGHDASTIVGHPDAGVVAGPRDWKKYAAVGAFVAVLAGGATYVTTRDDGPSPSDDESLLIDGDGGSDVIRGDSSDDVLRGDSSDDVILGEPGGDLLPGGDEPMQLPDGPGTEIVTGGSDDLDPLFGDDLGDDLGDAPDGAPDGFDALFDGSVPAPSGPFGVQQMCFDVQHQPVGEQNAASGIWVSGTVYGMPEGTWIWVQGSSVNDGDPIEIPIVDDVFEGPLGINAYGDHEIAAFELRDGLGNTLVDVLPQLDSGPGSTVTVGPDEGAPFSEPCFDLEPVFVDGAGHQTLDPTGGSIEPVVPVEPSEPTEGADETATAEPLDPAGLAQGYFHVFAELHVRGDSDALIAGMYPRMRDAFGSETCDEYIRSTTGSITTATVTRVGDVGPLTINAPGGPLEIERALPVGVDFVLTDGRVVPNDANLVIDGGEIFWLTQCGVE